MAGWIWLMILIGIIASVIIKVEKRGEPFDWDFLILLIIGLAIFTGVYRFFEWWVVRKFPPSDAGFWFFLIIGGLLVLFLFRFGMIVDDYHRYKEEEKREEQEWKRSIAVKKEKKVKEPED